MLVVLAGCTIPFAGGDGEVADDAGVSTEETNVSTDDPEADHSLELTEDEQLRAAGYEILADDIESTLLDNDQLYSHETYGTYVERDGERVGAAVVEVRLFDGRNLEAGTGKLAYHLAHTVEDESVGTFAVDEEDYESESLRPDVVIVEFNDTDNADPAGTTTIDVDDARAFAQGDLSRPAYDQATVGSIELREDFEYELNKDPEVQYLYHPDMDAFEERYDLFRPEYTEYDAATLDGFVTARDRDGEVGFAVTVQLNESHEIGKESPQAVNTVARVLNPEHDVREQLAEDIDFGYETPDFEQGGPDFVELQFEQEGELLGWVTIDAAEASAYMDLEKNTSEFAASTVGDFDIHKAGIEPTPEDTERLLETAELRSFASTYEELILETDNFHVNATYVDVDAGEVQIYSTWILDRSGHQSWQTLVPTTWHTMIYQPEANFPDSGVAYYVENPIEEGPTERNTNDNRGFAEIEPAYPVMEAQAALEDDRVSVATEYDRGMRDEYHIVLYDDDPTKPPRLRVPEEPFVEDEGW